MYPIIYFTKRLRRWLGPAQPGLYRKCARLEIVSPTMPKHNIFICVVAGCDRWLMKIHATHKKKSSGISIHVSIPDFGLIIYAEINTLLIWRVLSFLLFGVRCERWKCFNSSTLIWTEVFSNNSATFLSRIFSIFPFEERIPPSLLASNKILSSLQLTYF